MPRGLPLPWRTVARVRSDADQIIGSGHHVVQPLDSNLQLREITAKSLLVSTQRDTTIETTAQ